MNIKNSIVTAGVIGLFLSCTTNPFTGNKTLALVSNSSLFPTAFAQYDQFLTENNVITGTSDSDMIQRSRSTNCCSSRTLAKCKWSSRIFR